jgi:hypothetical protein
MLLLLALLASGCRPPAADVVHLAPGTPFRLCPPEAAPDFFANQEVVFGTRAGRQEILLATIENRAGVLNLVASTPLGQTLFIVRVQSGAVTVDARVPLPDRLDPRLLPALVQFALWPAEAVRAGLDPGTRLEQDGPRRTLWRRGKVVWTVTREGEAPPFRSLLLEHPGLGLTLRIRTLDE